MDARGYLSSRGWKGDGHGLGSTQTGIQKPLLISKKVDVLGVGLNRHAAVSDQWWLRAFDQKLKDFGTGKQGGALDQIKEHGHLRGGLYGRFVKGGILEGTIEDEQEESSDSRSSEDSSEESESESDESISSASVTSETSPEHSAISSESSESEVETSEGDSTVSSETITLPANMAKKMAKKTSKKSITGANNVKVGERKRKRDEGEETNESEVAKKIKTEEGMNVNGAANGVALSKDQPSVNEEELQHRIKACLNEAFRRGVIPPGPNEIRKGLHPRDGFSQPPLSDNDPFRIILDHITETHKLKAGLTTKKAKFEREKAKRELKRFARQIFAPGTKPLKKTAPKNPEKKEARKARQEAANAEQERLAKEKVERRKAKKELRQARKMQVTVENAIDSLGLEGTTQKPFPHSDGSDLANGADEVKLGLNNMGKVKKIPGVGAVERYPTKAEKKAKKAAAQKAFGQKVGARRMQKYEKAAEANNVSVMEYLQQKELKRLRKIKERRDVKEAKAREEKAEAKGTTSQPADPVGFVVDTEGDDALTKSKLTLKKERRRAEGKVKPKKIDKRGRKKKTKTEKKAERKVLKEKMKAKRAAKEASKSAQ